MSLNGVDLLLLATKRLSLPSGACLSRALGALFAGLVALGCVDKAEEGFRRCETLNSEGKLDEAAKQCEGAHQADPSSAFGQRAASKRVDIQLKLDEIVPTTVTLEWCSRLRMRLEARLEPQARQEYPNQDPGFVRQSVHDYVLNVEYNCRGDLGRATEGLWVCRWNENLNSKECEKFESARRDCKERCRQAMRDCIGQVRANGRDESSCDQPFAICRSECGDP